MGLPSLPSSLHVTRSCISVVTRGSFPVQLGDLPCLPCWSVLRHCDQVPEVNDLCGGRVTLAHRFRGSVRRHQARRYQARRLGPCGTEHPGGSTWRGSLFIPGRRAGWEKEPGSQCPLQVHTSPTTSQ